MPALFLQVFLLADADNFEVSGATPLGRAVLDVQRDFYQVLGYAPVVFNLPPAPGSLAPGTVVVTFGTAQSAPWMSALPTSACYAVRGVARRWGGCSVVCAY